MNNQPSKKRKAEETTEPTFEGSYAELEDMEDNFNDQHKVLLIFQHTKDTTGYAYIYRIGPKHLPLEVARLFKEATDELFKCMEEEQGGECECKITGFVKARKKYRCIKYYNGVAGLFGDCRMHLSYNDFPKRWTPTGKELCKYLLGKGQNWAEKIDPKEDNIVDAVNALLGKWEWQRNNA